MLDAIDSKEYGWAAKLILDAVVDSNFGVEPELVDWSSWDEVASKMRESGRSHLVNAFAESLELGYKRHYDAKVKSKAERRFLKALYQENYFECVNAYNAIETDLKKDLVSAAARGLFDADSDTLNVISPVFKRELSKYLGIQLRPINHALKLSSSKSIKL